MRRFNFDIQAIQQPVLGPRHVISGLLESEANEQPARWRRLTADPSA